MENKVKIEQIKQLELSWRLNKYLYKTGSSIGEFAAKTRLSEETIQKTLAGHAITKEAAKVVCSGMHQSYDSLSVPPIEEPSFSAMMSWLVLEGQMVSTESQIPPDRFEDVQKMLLEEFTNKDLIRATMWLKYILQHPNNSYSRIVLCQMEDLIVNMENSQTPNYIEVLLAGMIDEVKDRKTLDKVEKSLREAREKLDEDH